MGSGRLAEAHGLSPSYLTKQLQQLTQAGLVSSVPGPHGGFRLARALEDITLLDVVEAIEGDFKVFNCTEIRCDGKIGALTPTPPTRTCPVHAAMRRTEDTWRQALAAQTLADVRAELDVSSTARQTVRAALD
jgi:Rrf2 family protein